MPYADPLVRREKQREYQRKWFSNPENRKQQRGSVKRRQAEVLAEVNRLKSAPCTDCGGTYPPECMDFDHLPGTDKVDNVSTLLKSGGYEQVMAEIAKCELVCANCHRVRTKQRF